VAISSDEFIAAFAFGGDGQHDGPTRAHHGAALMHQITQCVAKGMVLAVVAKVQVTGQAAGALGAVSGGLKVFKDTVL
jgi:hypothetical protein